MQRDRFDDLVADGVDGVERGHRLLEDHGDVFAADGAHLPLAQRSRSSAFQEDLPAEDLARRLGNEPEDRQRRDRFPAPALADQRDGLPGEDA